MKRLTRGLPNVTNTPDKLIASIKMDGTALNKDTATIEHFCNLVLEANLPELATDYEYTHRLVAKDGGIVDTEIISHRRFWDSSLDCWNWDNETVVLVIPGRPY